MQKTRENWIIDAPMPIMAKEKMTFEEHGLSREDPYFWFKNKEDARVLEHLKAENTYYEAALRPFDKTRQLIFEEIKAREPEESAEPCFLHKDYYYQWTFPKGANHKKLERWKKSLGPAPDATERVLLLDINTYQTQFPNVRLMNWATSHDQNELAFMLDEGGKEEGVVYVKNLSTNDIVKTNIDKASHDLEWSADDKSIYWVALSKEWRPDRVFQYDRESKHSHLMYEEKDAAFFVGLEQSSDEKKLFISMYSKISAEVWEINNNSTELTLLWKRQPNIKVSFDHHPELKYFAESNIDHKNNGFYHIGPFSDDNTKWKKWYLGSDQICLSDVILFKDYVCYQIFEKGMPKQLVATINKPNETKEINYESESCDLAFTQNAEFINDVVRVSYSSLTTPSTVYDISMKDLSKTIVKKKRIGGGFDENDYKTEVQWAKSHDGYEFPISIMYRRDHDFTKPAPLALYGYGSYGLEMTAYFSHARLSLVDRGMIYAIAHIRGGGELGQQTYEDNAKFLKKKNTFYDFQAASEHLIKINFTAQKKITLLGGSAGGLLVGATMNLKPELYNSVIGWVAFVDVLNTMLDQDLPLTPIEWDEWGNPKNKVYYDYIKSYSPYDNVEKKNYPPCLFTGGLNDPRVTYWEPAKMVAKVRELSSSGAPVFLHTDLDKGHGGSSGRYDAFKEMARDYTFVLAAQGLI